MSRSLQLTACWLVVVMFAATPAVAQTLPENADPTETSVVEGLTTPEAPTPAADDSLPSVTVAEEEVVLTPGDEILVYIPEGAQLVEYRVALDEDGIVSLDLYGQVRLAGLSEPQANAALARHLETYLRSTSGVYLRLVEAHTLVVVRGRVAEPGSIRLGSGDGVVEALTLAGGAIPGADLTRVTILRGDRLIEVDAREASTDPWRANVPLISGDRLFVPANERMAAVEGSDAEYVDAEIRRAAIMVTGAVRQPGAYDRPASLDVWTAIILAGGPLADADLSQVRLVCGSEPERVDLANWLVDGREVAPMVSPDCAAAIHVPRLDTTEPDPFAETIRVVGAVNGPGMHRVRGAVSILDAVALAGGPTSEGNLARVDHVHEGDGVTIVSRYNVRTHTRRGGVLVHAEIVPGDTIVVAARGEGFWYRAGRTLSDVAVLAAATAVLVSQTSN